MSRATGSTEIGSYLGALSAPPDLTGDHPLDATRLLLLDRLVSLSHPPDVSGVDWFSAWLAAWREIGQGASAVLEALVDEALAHASEGSRMSERARKARYPTSRHRERWGYVLESAGIPLEEVVLAGPGPFGYEADLRRLGAATETAWLQLVSLWNTEYGRWKSQAQQMATWRPPSKPLWVLSGIVLGLSSLLGLVIGGVIRGPTWLRPVIDWWWSLPWP